MDCELTNMVMIENSDGSVLVQERSLSWQGIAFPGGHIESGESFFESAKREIREETGLIVGSLTPCGIIHWEHKEHKNKYIVFLYKCSDFSGELLHETEEGRVFWISPDKLKQQRLSKNFEKYLELFMHDEFCELYGLWEEDSEDELFLF